MGPPWCAGVFSLGTMRDGSALHSVNHSPVVQVVTP